MNLTSQQAALLLAQLPKCGPRTIKKLIDLAGSATEVLKLDLSKPKLINNFTKEQQRHLRQWQKGLAAMEMEEKFLTKRGINTLIYGEPGYPKSLSFIADPPSILFQQGQVNWQNPRLLSIVGTRQPTAAGLALCRQLMAELAPFNPLIISGFARGIDICAHREAIALGLETAAVLGHPFGQWYPRSHKQHVDELLTRGCFLSEYPSTASFDRTNFLRRNRIIAGLSHATIVIESGQKGGSLVTAAQALDYGREVFTLPGQVTDNKSQGCLQLIKTDRARIITKAADVAQWLEWEETPAAPAVQKQMFVSLTDQEQPLYGALQGKKSLDELALVLQQPVSKIARLLMQMELKGAVRSLPGKRFEKI